MARSPAATMLLLIGCGPDVDPGAPSLPSAPTVAEAEVVAFAPSSATAPSASFSPAPAAPACVLGTPARVALAPDTLGLQRLSNIDSLSVATAAGKSLIVFRSGGDVGCDHVATSRVEAVWVDPASGARVGKRATIAIGAVSSPAVLVRDAELSLIWSEAGKLRWASWGAAEPAVERLDIAGSEPTLARLPGSHVALAFASKGSIALGTGSDVRAAASTATSAGAGARSPRLAIDEAGEGHLAWLEKGPSGHAIVHRSVTCH